jgi:hypothetical protein
VSEPEQPGNEVFAASAEHESAVLAGPERRSSGNRYRWISINAGVSLRVARPAFAGCAMDREESGSSREHHLPPVKGETGISVFVAFLQGYFRCRQRADPSANFLSELSL